MDVTVNWAFSDLEDLMNLVPFEATGTRWERDRFKFEMGNTHVFRWIK